MTSLTPPYAPRRPAPSAVNQTLASTDLVISPNDSWVLISHEDIVVQSSPTSTQDTLVKLAPRPFLKDSSPNNLPQSDNIPASPASSMASGGVAMSSRDSPTNDHPQSHDTPASPASSMASVELYLTKIVQPVGAARQNFEVLMESMGWPKMQAEVFRGTIKDLARKTLDQTVSVTDQVPEDIKRVRDLALSMEKYKNVLDTFAGAPESPEASIEWPVWQALIRSCKGFSAKEKREDDKMLAAKARRGAGRRMNIKLSIVRRSGRQFVHYNDRALAVITPQVICADVAAATSALAAQASGPRYPGCTSFFTWDYEGATDNTASARKRKIHTTGSTTRNQFLSSAHDEEPEELMQKWTLERLN
ncbi:hypothetical protein IW261DRAFT_1415548 [Armillaria novae-zelandiae]|uniref:Uncharacterized protein n=1 Tax=Armillaria novae-zelandiae TaxID=153914 RepID=A0AA39PP50_9AGAR|nr:hypothetical protein IW261DRAFT_1415548 [Armillaria novae-zelandiae]